MSDIAPAVRHHLTPEERESLRKEAIEFVHGLLERDRFMTDCRDKHLSARCLLDELSERFEARGGRPALYEAFPDGPITEALRALGEGEDIVSGLNDPHFGSSF